MSVATKIVLFNGPPRAGKDTGAITLKTDCGAELFSFAVPLKRVTHEMFGIYDVPWDRYETVKDTSLDEFGGLTPRQAYIEVSEKIMKPRFGLEVWGERTMQYIYSRPEIKRWALTSFGFSYEANPLYRTFGKDNLLVIRVSMLGKTYENDSRAFIPDSALPDVKMVDIENVPGDVTPYRRQLLRIATEFFIG